MPTKSKRRQNLIQNAPASMQLTITQWDCGLIESCCKHTQQQQTPRTIIHGNSEAAGNRYLELGGSGLRKQAEEEVSSQSRDLTAAFLHV
jgi:hypothetical protein